ncbi:hypothetical protein GCM10025881_38660 [Pseudolysinimonas kribbensis]|uniref:Uncharacterized protein n=1 Tax=Pseudolysinimonas kribbensis TaxID=433641 RepID=A0ABQ6KAZ7_9MICO|nr:hypothetical protein [Pseudolysinimonas kribbensis]GMA97042.1 hypothetical protein GCM10025881_38660 [Pseudolysinimonas kribbensis]
MTLYDDFRHEAETRIAALTAEADAGALDPAIDILVEALNVGECSRRSAPGTRRRSRWRSRVAPAA